MFRIGIAGCAGTGKSSLAKGLSTKLGIPFLEAKAITGDILERDGYDYSSGVQIERFLANTGRQNEILRRTVEQQSVETFVTDRTVIDLAAYVACEMHDTEPKAVKDILTACKKHVTAYTHILLCPWQDRPVSENKRRTLNPWYQFVIHTMERGIMDEWGCKYHMVEGEGDSRLDGVLAVLEVQ